MAAERFRVIVNPAAGANSTRKKWPELKSLLTSLGLLFDPTYTEGSGHAIELARAAAGNGYRCLVAVGGDGTINEVANGILESGGGKDISLGIISTGTGSDFIRSVGIPRQSGEACLRLVRPTTRQLDIGIVEFQKDKQTRKRFFINAAGIGFDAAAVETTEHLPKNMGGTIPYLAGLLCTLVCYRNKHVTLRMAEKVNIGRMMSVVVSNGNFLGGGMRIAPDAVLDDGLLDVCVIGDVSKFDLLKSLHMVYKGTHGSHPKVRMDRAEKITVESEEKILVHADGDLLGEGPAVFSLMPKALTVIV
jgi:diacylglycerol kinase (ATP)